MGNDIVDAIDFPAGIGKIPLGDLAIRSGLEILQAMLRGEYPAPHIAKTLSFTLHEVEQDRVVFKGLPSSSILIRWAAYMAVGLQP